MPTSHLERIARFSAKCINHDLQDALFSQTVLLYACCATLAGMNCRTTRE